MCARVCVCVCARARVCTCMFPLALSRVQFLCSTGCQWELACACAKRPGACLSGRFRVGPWRSVPYRSRRRDTPATDVQTELDMKLKGAGRGAAALIEANFKLCGFRSQSRAAVELASCRPESFFSACLVRSVCIVESTSVSTRFFRNVRF